MSVFRAGNLDAVRLDQLDLSAVRNGTVSSKSATTMVIDQGGGAQLVLNGTGFTFDTSNHLTGGTITSLFGSSYGEATYGITDFALDAAQFDRWIAAGQTSTVLATIFAGSDLVVGSSFADAIYGYEGNDILFGLAGNDTIYGGGGEDMVYGGGGADVLYGGSGSDTFLATLTEANGDSYLDFARGDRIVISDAALTLTSFSAVALPSGSASVTITTSWGASTFTVSAAASSLATAVGAHGETLVVVKPVADNIADLNGDGRGDYLWQNSSGAISTWTVTGGANGQTVKENSFYATAAPSWKVVETFDWNGDGKADILWRNTDGTMSVWSANATNFQQGAITVGGVPTSWRIAATGDFTGDGKDDILWQNSDGAISEWTSTGTGFTQNSYYRASPGASWHVVQQADFNGDGKDDILWRADGGAIAIWNSNGSGFADDSFYDASVGKDWKIVATGDVNGDGRDDIVWQNGTQISVWQATSGGFDKNTQYLLTQFAPSGLAEEVRSVVGMEDVNGDGRADLMLRTADGKLTTWISDGHSFANVGYASQAAASWSLADHLFTWG